MVEAILDLPALERKEGIRRKTRKKDFAGEVDQAVRSIYG